MPAATRRVAAEAHRRSAQEHRTRLHLLPNVGERKRQRPFWTRGREACPRKRGWPERSLALINRQIRRIESACASGEYHRSAGLHVTNGTRTLPPTILEVFAVIPARGGSKGLPRKNILPLDGRPLISYTIAAAKAAIRVSRTFVSTEDAAIAAVARAAGAEVLPRPAELADDRTTSDEVVRQACAAWEAIGTPPDAVVYLQVTDLFRRKGIIDECVEALIADTTLDAAFAAFPEHKNYWVIGAEGSRRLNPYPDAPRQTRTPVFREDTGIACATRFETAKARGRIGANNRIISHEDEFSFVDIHTAEDLWLAQQLVLRCKGTGRYDF